MKRYNFLNSYDWNSDVNVVFGITKLIGTAISIQSSKEFIYPSITMCTYKSDSSLNYYPMLNKTLISVVYHLPDGSQQSASPLVPDVENRY